jgi:hypothetical protein
VDVASAARRQSLIGCATCSRIVGVCLMRIRGATALVHRGQQFAACLGAAATNVSTDTAVVMVGSVAVTLLGASATCDNTPFERGAYDAEVGFGLTGHDPARRVAHVGAVKVEPNAPHQLGHVRLAEAGVGAAGARGGTVEALVNAVQEDVAVKSDRPRMALDDFSYCHFASVPRWHFSSSGLTCVTEIS